MQPYKHEEVFKHPNFSRDYKVYRVITRYYGEIAGQAFAKIQGTTVYEDKLSHSQRLMAKPTKETSSAIN